MFTEYLRAFTHWTYHIYTWLWVGSHISVWLLFFQISFPTNTPHTCHRHMLPCLQNTQELVTLFIWRVASAYPAVRRKVSAVCYDDYLNNWAKNMDMKGRWKVWCHMASLGWKGLDAFESILLLMLIQLRFNSFFYLWNYMRISLLLCEIHIQNLSHPNTPPFSNISTVVTRIHWFSIRGVSYPLFTAARNKIEN
jgi:hypothetical protein